MLSSVVRHVESTVATGPEAVATLLEASARWVREHATWVREHATWVRAIDLVCDDEGTHVSMYYRTDPDR